MFSEDLGDCSRFPFNFPFHRVDLYYSRFVLFETNTFSAGILAFGPNLWVRPLSFKVLWTFSMLRLEGGPSVNTLPLTLFECSYSVSMASP